MNTDITGYLIGAVVGVIIFIIAKNMGFGFTIVI
jgi:tetrahydromethanopterin S-methyltransferase subunit G